MRLSMFLNFGKKSVYKYEDDKATETADIVDTLFYRSFDIIKGYNGVEPRISINYRLSEMQSFKASYNRMRQYIHLITNSSNATPIDVWAPSNTYIRPSTVDQLAWGYFRNFKDNMFESSLELYFKSYTDLVDYVDGANLLLNHQLETQLLNGKGRAYGAELMIRKQKGLVTGWMSYTLSRSERQINEINSGEWYPSNYDKLHDITFVAVYNINDKWDLSANFALATGRPITYPDSRYEYDGLVIANYNNRNGARIPTYHRLDLAATLTSIKAKKKKIKSSWVFGVYNVYARKNAYSIYFRPNEDDQVNTEAVRLSVFGTIIPSVTYNFHF
ncbi:MAG: TonB-dependent receptor [Bacteroidetes bacterium]|nr:TonB-dependent receptor [Bacteroidota bacterium]